MAESLDTSIRDDDIEFAKMFDRLLEQGCDLSWFGDIGFDGDGAGADGFNVLDDCFGGGRGARIADDEGCAAGGEFEGVLAAHASTGASHEGDFAVKTGSGRRCCCGGRHIVDQWLNGLRFGGLQRL